MSIFELTALTIETIADKMRYDGLFFPRKRDVRVYETFPSSGKNTGYVL